MVKHCVSSKYSGPTCYDITKGESKTIRQLTLISLVCFAILLVIFTIYYCLDIKDITKKPFFRGLFVFAGCIFLSMLVYQIWVVSHSKILCRGYVDCNKI